MMSDMRSDPRKPRRRHWLLWNLAGACLALVYVGSVMACAILGGPTPDTTSTRCSDGSRCPNGYVCPSPMNPSGRCEAAGPAPTAWGATRSDAGP